MSRIHCDKKMENLEDAIRDLQNELDDYFEEIVDEIDSLVIDIREERLIDIEDIESELIGIRDRIVTHY